MPSSADTVLQAAGLAGLLLAAVTDVRKRIIPNGTVIWVLGTGLLARFIADGWAGGWSVLISFALFIPLAALTHRGFIGGGDAKMIPAAVTLVEPAQTLGLLAAIVLAGGLLSGVFLSVSAARRLRPGAQAITAVAPPTLPYGAAIFAGVAFILFQEAYPCFSATSCSQ